jgi:hypothetical protein
MYDRVYQFKITLKGIKPPVWRRIQVPGVYSFWDLHVAIQDSMGWMDCHLHEFEMENSSTGGKEHIGIPLEDDFDDEREILPGWKIKIGNYFTAGRTRAKYRYDFGDDWRHEVVLEKIEPRAEGASYPICIDGKRACPPEDCGGPHGYENFLEIIMDPANEQYGDMLAWVGGEFDPERFDPQNIRFDDPAKRLKRAME